MDSLNPAIRAVTKPGDLQFSGERVRPVKAFDTEGRVIYCGSFSECLSPGLRIGWIAAGRYIERVRRLKFISTLKGGFFLWAQLPEGVDSLELFHSADANGIHIAPGRIFCPHASVQNRIRLSCGHPCDERIHRGIERLGKLVRKLQKKGLRTL